jgi:GNAT superfamily N-acetyltransferase
VTLTASSVEIRPYADADEPAVLALLERAMGGGPAGRRTAAFFRWKHLENPFGRSLLLVACVGGEIVGLRAFMRWRLVADGAEVRAVRAVDTATDPAHQGRGIFRTLTLRALEVLEGEAHLVFNTPNQRSLPGYLTMGWRVVGRVPVRVRPRRPLRALRAMRPGGGRPLGPDRDVGEPVAAALADEEAVGDLLARAARREHRLATERTAAFLRWRYGAAPGLAYRAFVERREGRLQGLAFLRLRERGQAVEAAVADVVVPTGDAVGAARLLRRVVRAVGADHLTCAFPRGTDEDRAARRARFVSWRGPVLVVRSLVPELRPDPVALRSWAMRLGDLEVF